MTEYEKLRATIAAQLAAGWLVAMKADKDWSCSQPDIITGVANTQGLSQADGLLEMLEIYPEKGYRSRNEECCENPYR